MFVEPSEPEFRAFNSTDRFQGEQRRYVFLLPLLLHVLCSSRFSKCFQESEERIAPRLSEQVRAGLRLYILTAELLGPVLRTEDRPLITHTVQLIRAMLD